MIVAPFDIVGIVVFLLVAAFIYRKGWFFSFYSFFKFAVVAILSLASGLILAGNISYNLPVTKLQLSLLLELLVFIVLWKAISFKKVFFAATDSVVSLNRFVFTHHLDRILNIFPSAAASFFVTFFLFTVALSASTGNPTLQIAIENSKILKPLSYRVYFAAFNIKDMGLFNGIAFKMVPAVKFEIPGASSYHPPQNAPASLGPTTVPPAGGTKTFIPPTSIPVYIPPTAIPIPTARPILTPRPLPTSTPFILPTRYVPPQQYIPPTSAPPQPTSTPAPTSAPIIPAVQQPADITQAEQDIFRLTNEQRAQHGVPPLVWSDTIANVARLHSQDMETRHYFEHITPDGMTLGQRLQLGGVSYNIAAENIAAAPTADIIMDGWMNGPGEDQPISHRANILNPAFNKVGIGATPDPKYGLMVTQNFTN